MQKSCTEVITEFYTAFSRHDGDTMAGLYHPDARFYDPVFLHLNAREAGAMWQMLIERSDGNLDIRFRDVQGNQNEGTVIWEAKYGFGPRKRPVHNIITAKFTCHEGLIVNHRDNFSFHRWSRQAIGFPLFLLGYTGLLQQKVQSQSKKLLAAYLNQKQ
jgi:hypothetical protein